MSEHTIPRDQLLTPGYGRMSDGPADIPRFYITMDTTSNEDQDDQEASDTKEDQTLDRLVVDKYEDAFLPYSSSCESISKRYQPLYFSDPGAENRRKCMEQHSKVVKSSSVLLVTVGFLSCASNLTCIFLGDTVSLVGAGMWGGAMFMLTGSLGICSSKTKKNMHMILFLVVTLLTTVVSVGPVVVGALGLTMANDDQIMYEKIKDNPIALRKRPRLLGFNKTQSRIVAGFHGFIIFAGLLSCILSLLILVNACNTVFSYKNQVLQPAHTLIHESKEKSGGGKLDKSPRPLYLVKTYRLTTLEK